MSTELKTRIILRNDEQANWTKNRTLILKKGEVGIEFLKNGVAKLKIGNGSTQYGDLPYFDCGSVKEQYALVSLLPKTRSRIQDNEVRVMFPKDTAWTKQESSTTSEKRDPNCYYFGVKIYAPENDKITKYRMVRGTTFEGNEEIHTFNEEFSGVDPDGRKYDITWLAAAQYRNESEWYYYGKDSQPGGNFTGYTLTFEWLDDAENVLESQTTRVNLATEENYNDVTPVGAKVLLVESGDGNAISKASWDPAARKLTLEKELIFTTKEDVDGAIDAKLASFNAVFHFKGTKESYSELAQVHSPDLGDTYQVTIKSDDPKQYALYAWDGDNWAEIGGADVDLSPYENKIEKIAIGENELPIEEKKVTIPLATGEKAGVVKGTSETNKITFGKDGTGEVNSLGVSKLVNDDVELILNGGDANIAE